ncbi:EAL domain-containing protein [Pseudomonas lini]
MPIRRCTWPSRAGETAFIYSMSLGIRRSRPLTRPSSGCVRRCSPVSYVCIFQPKVNMRRGVVVGFEALLRWEHPQNGMVPPREFFCHW